MIVVDTNVLAYGALPSIWQTAVEALRHRDPDWVVPLLWRSEFRNFLAGCIRRGALSLEQACELQASEEDRFKDRQYEVESRSVLALVQASRCTSYDCEFVALARRLNVKLVTMDKQLLSEFPQDTLPLAA